MLLCYVNGLSVCYFFLQINSNGRELKLMTSDQKIVRVSLAETVSLIFMSCSAIFMQAWAAHALCIVLSFSASVFVFLCQTFKVICCFDWKLFEYLTKDFKGHILFWTFFKRSKLCLKCYKYCGNISHHPLVTLEEGLSYTVFVWENVLNDQHYLLKHILFFLCSLCVVELFADKYL